MNAELTAPVEETPPAETPGQTPLDRVKAWSERRAHWLLLALILALLPYLIACNGVAILMVKGLLTGTCGGG
jgi:hypothetical protein